jgi:hypothetical protein
MAIVSDIFDFVEELQQGFYDYKLLIEGDSWVSHPFPGVDNLSIQFNDFKPQNALVLNIAEPGDEANAIFKAHGRQMKRLKRLLDTEQWGDRFDLIFLSAAGNDIVGPEIISRGYVKNKRDFPKLLGRELLTDNFYDVLSDVARGYERFLKLRNNSALNEATPVITHVYSYLTPREVGTHIGPLEFSKGWIKRHLRHQGIRDEAEQYDIVVEMLDAFYRRLVLIEQKYANFLVVDTRTVLSKNGAPDPALWYDEIHPNSKGFRKVAQYIRKQARAKGLWYE